PVILSEKFLYTNDLSAGNTVEVTGQFRSYNNYTDIGNRLVLSVFARNITPVSSPEEAENPNAIQLTGYICKAPVYRTTPFGREITDLLIAVNRAYNKSDYIPCIAWGLNAKYASVLSVGEKLRLTGRIQSREYKKKYDDETIETKTAYEVSISRLESIS
ncbi:MAG: single-stranded DNA-binding protein, partial [Clostridia bacterium]|nr:single-stranded DNA-binding protein [Clostridia bacterium]